MLEPYYRINQATGVSINLLPNGETVINACSVIIKDNRLDFEKKVNALNTVEELNKHFPAKTCLALNLFGKGVLQKKIEKLEEVNQNNFSQILPNANFDDFYIQNFISGDWSFVSVIRKTDADKWIDLLKKQGFFPLMLSLGPFPVQNIASQLNVYDSELVFDGYTIERNEQLEWISCRYKETAHTAFPLKVESEAINENLLIAYSAAFQLVLASKLAVIRADAASLEKDFQKRIADKKLQVNGFLVLLVFFILLLINFLVLSWISSSNAKLADKVSQSAQSTNNLQGINEHVKNKEALLKNLGWDGGINKSYLIDQLAALLPGEISWKEITINPIDMATSRVQKSLQFMDRKIRITGSSEKIISVNEWIARVKTKKWVRNIQLDSYVYNSELNTGLFTIIIDY